MNEVREIVARMLEDPTPPPRAAELVLATARQASRRRSVATASGVGALALVVVLGAGVAVRSLRHMPPASAPVTTVAAPMAEASATHGRVLAEKILAALPPGLHAGAVETFSDSAVLPTASAPTGAPHILAGAIVRVFNATGEGEVFAYLVRDDGPWPAACGDQGDPGAQCWAVAVDDVTVQVERSADPDRGTKIEAVRVLDGGALVVGAWSGPPTGAAAQVGPVYVFSWPALPEPPLDTPDLVALAADPAMLPS